MALPFKSALPFALIAAALPLAACAARDVAPAAAAAAPQLTVRGRAGPFASATVTVARTGPPEQGGFSAVLETGTGKRMPLPGPDDPADFFILEPKAVLLTPAAGLRENVVVLLYTSSRIGPGNGTDRKALVYRITAAAALRQPAAEARLEGVATPAEARARLGRRR